MGMYTIESNRTRIFTFHKTKSIFRSHVHCQISCCLTLASSSASNCCCSCYVLCSRALWRMQWGVPQHRRYVAVNPCAARGALQATVLWKLIAAKVQQIQYPGPFAHGLPSGIRANERIKYHRDHLSNNSGARNQ